MNYKKSSRTQNLRGLSYMKIFFTKYAYCSHVQKNYYFTNISSCAVLSLLLLFL
jgi:hypothetical protein